jgi:outer membrane receptor for ferrienterochelin and colicin
MTKYIFISVATFIFSVATAGEKIRGYVYDEQDDPVMGAHVRWEESRVGTVTDADGFFEIEWEESGRLIISYVGYATSTVTVERQQEPLRIVLTGEVALEEVVVNERRPGMVSSRTEVIQTQRITYEELCRAACCNLAESFETNPSVDVSYTDAATGARRIKLLGLSGVYVQMLTENCPNFRGAASLYGPDYVPGPWMESIQISKGTSSVKNGYEAIAGQINVEFKKPTAAEPFSVNVFADDAGRYEVNGDAFRLINDNLSAGLLVHYSSDRVQHDDNRDGFLDMPLREQVNVMNRWQHRAGNYVSQYGVQGLYEDRTGGQAAKLYPLADPYRIKLRTKRLEGYTKQTYIPDSGKAESIALILSGSAHGQQATFDRTPCDIYQKSVYASLMYETGFSAMHRLSAGLSLNYDGFDEHLTRDGVKSIFDREEVVPGAYVQYTYNVKDRLILLAGLRADNSSAYGFFVTLRLHLKYNPFEWFHLRASAGKGFRTAHVLAENSFLLSGSRKMIIAADLDREEAWNAGVNFSFYVPLGGKDLTVNAEWYYTNFNKQIVVDMDSNPHEVRFYNLEGKSYASSFQVEASYPFPFLRGFTLTGACRYTDTGTDYRNVDGVVRRLKRPLTGDYRGLLTASWQTPLKKWQLDLTGQFCGGGRMPVPDAEKPLWDANFRPYSVWNVQVTRFFRRWSVYAGAENLFDFTQDHPLIDAAVPRGDSFDGSMIWGRVYGRKFYAGLRVFISMD